MLLAVAPTIIVTPVIIIAPVVRIAIKLEISTVAVISLYISRELAVAQSIVVNYNITTLIKKSDIDVSVAYCPGNTVCYIIVAMPVISIKVIDPIACTGIETIILVESDYRVEGIMITIFYQHITLPCTIEGVCNIRIIIT